MQLFSLRCTAVSSALTRVAGLYINYYDGTQFEQRKSVEVSATLAI